MLKLKDLATRADFDLGPLSVSPSRRRVRGPAGEVQLEPLIMQVFLLLLDAGGRVVTRNELFDQVWGGVIVGDDSLNRAIAKVRRIESAAAPGLFEIETIPRTGYRVTGPIVEALEASTDAARAPASMSRRTLIASSAAALAVVGGAGLWSVRSRQARDFDSLIQTGREAIEYGDAQNVASTALRKAVAMRPDDPQALGLLAYALLNDTDSVFRRGRGADVQAAQGAADRALALDPGQAEAELARVILQRPVLDMETTEDRLRAILAKAPDNIFAMRELWDLLQCGGRSLAALKLVDRAIAVKPLAASSNFPRAQLLWITGRTAEADRVIDTAMGYWPEHRYVRFARFTIFAFTGRARAALAMFDHGSRPQNFSDASIALWRPSLMALEQPSAANIATARRLNVEAAEQAPQLAPQAVLTLSALNEVDAAFEVANKLLLFRRAAEERSAANGQPQKSTAWRFTPWVFTPPCAAMRSDPRFLQLCDGTGLTDYWRNRNVKPDYLA